MKQIVYVLLRGGIYPSTFVGTYATAEGAREARKRWRKDFPDQRFLIIDSEVHQ